MRATGGFLVGLFLAVPVVAQPVLLEPPDFPAEPPYPGAIHPGTGCFWLASGSIEPGDVDRVQVTLPFDSDSTVVDVDFASGGASSMLLASIPNVISVFGNDDGNNLLDGRCGLGADSSPPGSTQDSVANLRETPAGSIIEISVTGSGDWDFVGNHSEQFTYDLWVYAVGEPTGCTSNADCDDGIDCTTDTCDVPTGTCTNTPDDSVCDNGVFCDGTETCDPANDCQGGTPPDCDDGVSCTIDECNPGTDACENLSDDGLCNDGLFCNGVETCDPLHDCQPGTWPCQPGEVCDEINGCYSLALPTLDIRPGACPNRVVTQGRGVLPMALTGTQDVPANEIDPTTLALSRTDGVGEDVYPNLSPPGPHVVFDDVATPFTSDGCACHSLSEDGIVDLIMMFRIPELIDRLELAELNSGALLELRVTGETVDGLAFTATDCVQVIQRHGGHPAKGLR